MFYTSNPFDRADQVRKDESKTTALWHSGTARIVPYFLNKVLVSGSSDTPVALTLDYTAIPVLETDPIFLGFREEIPYFVIDLSELQNIDFVSHHQNVQTTDSDAEPHWEDLRVVGPRLSPDDGAMLAYARALMHWQQQTARCNLCGHQKRSGLSGHVRVCTNSECGQHTFPRTDPAVIMLVTSSTTDNDPSKERCLLGRSPQWPNGVYSTLAGFVEPGETLEAAVSREVFEEAGIYTTNVKYMASQPWPFPQSIMLGFRAEATSTEIRIDPDELADAAWFTRKEIAEFGNWGDDSYALQLPRPDSIARFLIDTWVSEANAISQPNL